MNMRLRVAGLLVVGSSIAGCDGGVCVISEDMRTACIPACVGTEDTVQLLTDLAVGLRRDGELLANVQARITGLLPANCGSCSLVISETAFLGGRNDICSSIPAVSNTMRTTCIPDCVGTSERIETLILISEASRVRGETSAAVQQALVQARGAVCEPCVRVVVEEVYLQN